MVGLVGGLLVALILLGLFYPGSGADQVNWRPTRSVETEVQNENDDLDEMLEAANEKRRARGAAELTGEAIHQRVAEDRRLGDEDREAYPGGVEIEQLLAIKNERRDRHGLQPVPAATNKAAP